LADKNVFGCTFNFFALQCKYIYGFLMIYMVYHQKPFIGRLESVLLDRLPLNKALMTTDGCAVVRRRCKIVKL
jgi:hypothetical protein